MIYIVTLSINRHARGGLFLCLRAATHRKPKTEKRCRKAQHSHEVNNRYHIISSFQWIPLQVSMRNEAINSSEKTPPLFGNTFAYLL